MPVGFRRLPPSPAHPRRVVGLTANCAGRSKDLRSTTTGPMKPTSSPPRRSTPASTQVPPQASQKATNPSPTTRTPSLLAPAPALAGRFAVSTKGKGASGGGLTTCGSPAGRRGTWRPLRPGRLRSRHRRRLPAYLGQGAQKTRRSDTLCPQKMKQDMQIQLHHHCMRFVSI